MSNRSNSYPYKAPHVTVMAVFYNAIPPEILTDIFGLLSRSDLKNVRLVSHVWDDVAQQSLFKTTFLRINNRSFERLRNIAERDKLCEHVRVVCYDGGILSGLAAIAARQGFQDWLQHSAAAGLGMTQEVKKQFLAQFTLEQLENYYSNYCNYLSGQDNNILMQQNEEKLLIEVLQKLPRLLGIRYTVTPRAGPEMTARIPELRSLSSLAREILAEPDDAHVDGTHFWTLLQAACVAGHAQGLKSVFGSPLHLNRFVTAGNSFPVSSRTLPALNELSLEFRFQPASDYRSDELTATIVDMVSQALSLATLHLSFGRLLWGGGAPIVHLPEGITNGLYWNRLRILSLRAMTAAEASLRTFLQNHAATIRSLELSDIIFNPNILPDQSGPDAWVHFIQFLEQEMSLESVRFDGFFSNLRAGEGWLTHDADLTDPSVRYSDDCLKYQIERFITHEGPLPFGDMDEPHYLGDWRWVYQDDISWQYVLDFLL